MTRTPTTSTHRILGGLALGTSLALGVTSLAAAAPTTDRLVVRHLEANLHPSGDPDGSGHADFRLNKRRHRVCAEVTWQNIADPNAAHIHRRSDGGIVVDLTGSVTDGANCATGVSRRLIGRILEHPRRFYFNVHNDPYPAGAIQGRLRR